MRPWDTFSAREADDFDYGGLADVLKPDWELLDLDHWKREFINQFRPSLTGTSLDRRRASINSPRLSPRYSGAHSPVAV